MILQIMQLSRKFFQALFNDQLNLKLMLAKEIVWNKTFTEQFLTKFSWILGFLESWIFLMSNVLHFLSGFEQNPGHDKAESWEDWDLHTDQVISFHQSLLVLVIGVFPILFILFFNLLSSFFTVISNIFGHFFPCIPVQCFHWNLFCQ